MTNLALSTEPPDPDKPMVRTIPDAYDADHQDHWDRKRIEREDRLDRFEQDCDYRTRASWP